MTDYGIHTKWVKVPNDALQIDSYLAEPEGDGLFPAIVVIQEIWGVNAHIQSVTERLAKEGYVAIAPAIYQRTARGFSFDEYTEETTKLGRKYKDLTRADELLSDVQAVITFLITLPKLKRTRSAALVSALEGT